MSVTLICTYHWSISWLLHHLVHIHWSISSYCTTLYILTEAYHPTAPLCTYSLKHIVLLYLTNTLDRNCFVLCFLSPYCSCFVLFKQRHAGYDLHNHIKQELFRPCFLCYYYCCFVFVKQIHVSCDLHYPLSGVGGGVVACLEGTVGELHEVVFAQVDGGGPQQAILHPPQAHIIPATRHHPRKTSTELSYKEPTATTKPKKPASSTMDSKVSLLDCWEVTTIVKPL